MMTKMALIHGWDYKNYSKFADLNKNVWHNRMRFMDRLSQKYETFKTTLPGFYGVPDPGRKWNVETFSDYFEQQMKKNNFYPDFVLGYSFGAPVALNWKVKYQSRAPLILVSPAIARKYSEQKNVKKLSKLKPFIPACLVHLVRDLYLRFYVKNSYYNEATPVMRDTYLNIVKIDSTPLLSRISLEEFVLIFGSKDTATPPSILLDKVNDQIKSRIKIIQGGTHDIANTHTKELLRLIHKFIIECKKRKEKITAKDADVKRPLWPVGRIL